MVGFYVVKVTRAGRRFAESWNTWAEGPDEARRKIAARLTTPGEVGQAYQIHR